MLFNPLEGLKTNHQSTSNTGKYVELLNLCGLWWECQMMQSLWGFAMTQKVHS